MGLCATKQDEIGSYMLPFGTAEDNQMPPAETKICTLIIVAYDELQKHSRMLACSGIGDLSSCPILWTAFENTQTNNNPNHHFRLSSFLIWVRINISTSMLCSTLLLQHPG